MPPTRSARAAARPTVRLATTTRRRLAVAAQRVHHALAHRPRPRPRRRPGRRSVPPSLDAASSTATCDSDVAPWAMAVVERTLRPAWTAWRKRLVEHRPAGLLGLGPLRRPSHLAEDLGLAQDARAQPGGHLEEVHGHGVVEEHRPVSLEDLDRAPGHRRQELLEVGHPFVEPLDHGVELGPQAGGQDDHLGPGWPGRADPRPPCRGRPRRPPPSRAGRAGPGAARDLRRRRTTSRRAPCGGGHPPPTRALAGPDPSPPGCRSAQRCARPGGGPTRPCRAQSVQPGSVELRPTACGSGDQVRGGPGQVAVGEIEAHDLQLDGQVDVAQQDVGGHGEDPGGEIEQRPHPGRHHPVGHVLGGGRPGWR